MGIQASAAKPVAIENAEKLEIADNRHRHHLLSSVREGQNETAQEASSAASTFTITRLLGV